MKNSALFILVALAVTFGGLYVRKSQKANEAKEAMQNNLNNYAVAV